MYAIRRYLHLTVSIVIAISIIFYIYIVTTSYKLKPPVMVPNPGQSLPVSDQNLVFSNLDKAVLVLMYPRAKPHDAAPEWTAEYALSVVGVPKVFHPLIIGDRSPDGIRKRFMKWNKINH